MFKALTAVVAVALTVYCVFDIAQTSRAAVRTLPKVAWFAVVLVPLAGPLAWFLAGRARHEEPPPPGRQRVVGPDDDPDFLWKIEERERRNRRRRDGGPAAT